MKKHPTTQREQVVSNTRRERAWPSGAFAAVVRRWADRGWLAGGRGTVVLRTDGGLYATPLDKALSSCEAHDVSRTCRSAVLESALTWTSATAAAVLSLPQVAALAMRGRTVALCQLNFRLEQLGVASTALQLSNEQRLAAALSRADGVVMERFGVLLTAAGLEQLEQRAEQLEHAATVMAAVPDGARLERPPPVAAELLGQSVSDGWAVSGGCGGCNACPEGSSRRKTEEVNVLLSAAISNHLQR